MQALADKEAAGALAPGSLAAAVTYFTATARHLQQLTIGGDLYYQAAPLEPYPLRSFELATIEVSRC